MRVLRQRTCSTCPSTFKSLHPTSQTTSLGSGLPHLLFIGSESHLWLESLDFRLGPNILEAIIARPADGKWDGLTQGASTKLLAQYVANSIAQLGKSVKEPEVKVTSVCPGATKSDLMRYFTGFPMNVALKMFGVTLNKTSEQGARLYVNAVALQVEAHGNWYKTTALTK